MIVPYYSKIVFARSYDFDSAIVKVNLTERSSCAFGSPTSAVNSEIFATAASDQRTTPDLLMHVNSYVLFIYLESTRQ